MSVCESDMQPYHKPCVQSSLEQPSSQGAGNYRMGPPILLSRASYTCIAVFVSVVGVKSRADGGDRYRATNCRIEGWGLILRIQSK
jgi:hypothetical protein